MIQLHQNQNMNLSPFLTEDHAPTNIGVIMVYHLDTPASEVLPTKRTFKTDQNKTGSYEKIWFRVTCDLVSWHACQSHNLMWVGLKRIGHIANTTHLIAVGEACAMILVD